MTIEIQRLSAFPFEGKGGNPAGVVLRAEGLKESQMQDIAAQIAFSETIFVTAQNLPRLRVRYFSPEMEVDFCGHATIAAGVALGEANGVGKYIFETNTGDVLVKVSSTVGGFAAELTSTTGLVSEIADGDLLALLKSLGWSKSLLAPGYKPLIANAGNSHPVLVMDSIETLQTLDYDFENLKSICRVNKWPTVQIVAQESETVWHSRNPFAFGGVYEDPATGSAAVAFGVYLRETGKIQPSESFTIKQGFALGQPCLLKVSVGQNACSVSGTAIKIDE
jgi:PhzF family phenazine biosynthesis protein